MHGGIGLYAALLPTRMAVVVVELVYLLMRIGVIGMQNDDQIELKYAELCETPSDINEHLPTLKKYAERCDHVTEMGVRGIVSTYALLAGRPRVMVSYDIVPVDCSTIASPYTDFSFRVADSRTVVIAPTDLLFIDTLHNESQLQIELHLHAAKVSKFIILHDTETFGTWGESETLGLLPALYEFLRENHYIWRVTETFQNNNGLTVLSRISS